MRKASRIWIAIGMGLLAAILAINAGVAYQNTRRVHDSAAQVAHTHEVMDALESLFSTIKDAETGQRGYLITGEEVYLRPYNEALARYRAELEQVARLTADNDKQQERVIRLRGRSMGGWRSWPRPSSSANRVTSSRPRSSSSRVMGCS